MDHIRWLGITRSAAVFRRRPCPRFAAHDLPPLGALCPTRFFYVELVGFVPGAIAWAANLGLQILGCENWAANLGLHISGCKSWAANLGLQILGRKSWAANVGLRCRLSSSARPATVHRLCALGFVRGTECLRHHLCAAPGTALGRAGQDNSTLAFLTRSLMEPGESFGRGGSGLVRPVHGGRLYIFLPGAVCAGRE